ncbi:MAG: ribonuclease M5 [Solobacterium sp.]|nr:ribonuclease M5 [Solobacterium sp.]
MKPVIREVIVVEGAHDTAHLKRYFDCETIETHGLGIEDTTIEAIREAKKRTGVIIFTDPDTPGEMIRRTVDEAVPGCAHAFVMKEQARTPHKVGVEHASCQALAEALSHTVTFEEEPRETISASDFSELGLSGSVNSEALRTKAAEALHLGYANAKTLRKRMNRLGITKEEVKEILDGETDCERSPH